MRRPSWLVPLLLLSACQGKDVEVGDTDLPDVGETDEPGETDATETDPASDDTDDTDVATVTVDATGGVLEGGDVRVVVPPGALDHEVTLTVRRLADTPRADAWSDAYDFGPDGLTFLQPVEVWIDHGGGDGGVVWWSVVGDETTFAPLVTRDAAGVARADVDHFSVGFVTAPLASSDTDTDQPTDTFDTDFAPIDTDTVDTDTPLDTDTDVEVPDTGLSIGCVHGCEVPVCGDGEVAIDEACDDGDTDPGDGCGSTCRLEACGNGVLDPGESCDDGNTVSTDACPTTCQPSRCGDLVVGPGEDCDDGGQGGDGCDATCHFEPVCSDTDVDTDAIPDTDPQPPSLPPGCTTPPPTAFGSTIALPTWFGLDHSAGLAAAEGVLVLGANQAIVDGLHRAGRVDVWRRTGRSYEHEATLTADTPATDGFFGGRPATDGATIVVHQATPYGIDVYRRTGGAWVPDGVISPAPTTTWAVDGDRLVVSYAQDANGRGVVSLYERTGPGTWTMRDQLLGPSTSAGLGTRLALSGDTLAAVANDGKLRLYRIESPLGYTLLQTVSASADGDVHFDGDSLAVKRGNLDIDVYQRSGDTWTLEDSVYAPQSSLRSTFGFRDGLVVLGAYNQNSPGYGDSLVVWRRLDGQWSTESRIDATAWADDTCGIDQHWNDVVVADDGYVVTASKSYGDGGALMLVDVLGGTCGDGQADPTTEACDDGNTLDGDGCGADCRLECGDDHVDPLESCDDGGVRSGDGCSAACQLEVCGNAVVDPTEECDDGAQLDGDGCDAACAWEPVQADLGSGGHEVGTKADVHGDSAMISTPTETLWYRLVDSTWGLVQSTPTGGVGAFDGDRAVVGGNGLQVLSNVAGQWGLRTTVADGWTVDVAMEGETVVAAVRGDLRVYRHDGTTLTPLDTVAHPVDCSYTAVAIDQTRIAGWCDGGTIGEIDVFDWDGTGATPSTSYAATPPSGATVSNGLAMRGGLLAWVQAESADTCEEAWWVRAVRLDGPVPDDLGWYGPVSSTSVATDGVSLFAAPTPTAVEQVLPDAGWELVASSGPIGTTAGWRTTYTARWDPTRQSLAVGDGWVVRGNPAFSTSGVVFFVEAAP